ncbi:MAG: histidine--tRNA ligase [Candidatus Sungbacteria bacterium]|nr:histidine--tRNA ligase [Candidatus Sungbacteria bacterium]
MGRKKKFKPSAFAAPKGTHDILPEEQKYWERVRHVARALFSFYNFGRIDTPHIEETELFMRSVGRETDIVEKEMYSFVTTGGDELTLRPEGTASVVRAYLQNGFVNRSHPVKLYYFGSFFRHENPQRGRFREFNQTGLEIIGDENAVSDAEIMHIFSVFLKELGIPDYVFHVNSVGCKECRPHYRSSLLQYYRPKAKGLCRDCKRRLKQNPLRILDCKEEKCQVFKANAPQFLDNLCEACKKHFTLLLEFLDENAIPYTLDMHLVRGIDYYTRTVFEVFVNADPNPNLKPEREEIAMREPEEGEEEEKAKEGEVKPDVAVEKVPEEKPVSLKGIAIASGGRYDDLVQLLGGRPTPAVGGAIGLERLVYVMKMLRAKTGTQPKNKVFFVQLGDMAKKKSFKIIEELRDAGISAGESLGRDSIKSQLKIADKSQAEFSLILGQKEAIDGTIIIREMGSGNQEIIPFDRLIDTLKKKLKRS